MKCESCGSESYRMRFHLDGSQSCNHCGDLPPAGLPDVFFKGAYTDPHLVDVNKPEQKNGVRIESRRQKAELMARLGVSERGDRQRGCRLEDKFAIRRETERVKWTS